MYEKCKERNGVLMKVGDLITVKKNAMPGGWAKPCQLGEKAIIRLINREDIIGLEFFSDVKGHTLCERTKPGHGYWIKAFEIEKINGICVNCNSGIVLCKKCLGQVKKLLEF